MLDTSTPPVTAEPGAAAPAPRLTYQPALDGLRAIALLGVIGYHAGIDALGGGFLGVSAFFTLSGFLITSLLLTERIETGRVALGSFWMRRVRRLLPAAMLTVVATVLLAALVADDSQLSRLRVDALSSLFHFSNWRFIAGGDSYGALFDSPSFFRHFWSLAVEEQFYVVFPLLVAAGLRFGRGPGRGFALALASVAVAAVLWPVLLAADGATTDRLYFGTDARLGEMVVGAALALWWVRRGRAVADRPALITAAAGLALLALGVMWVIAHPDDRSLYRGGLALHAVLTVVVIIAAIAPRGPVRRVLSLEPLRRIGVVSYGAYLFHWPILLVLQQETSLGPVARFAIGASVATGLAFVSHRFLEQPIRRGPRSARAGRIWLVVPASALAALLVVGVTVWRQPAEPPIDFAAAQAEFAALMADPPVPVPAPSPSVSPPSASAESPAAVAGATEVAPEPEPVRLAGFGDSTALTTGVGVARWGEANPDRLVMVQGQAKLGCGIVTGGIRRLEERALPVPDDCDPWLDQWIDAIEGRDVDIAYVQLGAWEITDHQVQPGGPFLAIGRDAEYEAMLRDGLDAALAALLDHVEMVALLTHPDIGQGRLATVPAGTSYPEYDPSRTARWREIQREAAAAEPRVVLVDLAGWVEAQADDLQLRPDGVHFTIESTHIVAEWLAPELAATYQTWREGSA